MTNKEKFMEYAKERIIAKNKRKERDFLGHTVDNLDRIYKRNYRGKKRRGQI